MSVDLIIVFVAVALLAILAGIVVKGLLAGVRPATVGLLLAATYAFAGMSVWLPAADGAVFSPVGCVLAVLAAAAFLRTRIAPAWLIFLCAGAAAVAGRHVLPLQ